MQLKFSLIPRQDETSICTDIPLGICPLAISIGRRHIGIEKVTLCFECIYCLKAFFPREDSKTVLSIGKTIIFLS